MSGRFKDLALDANDHQALADRWRTATGHLRLDVHDPPADGWVRPVPIVDPEGNEFRVFAPR